MAVSGNDNFLINRSIHSGVDSRVKRYLDIQVPQFSALKLSPVPPKDDCCCEGACETQVDALPEKLFLEFLESTWQSPVMIIFSLTAAYTLESTPECMP
jgi:hypothetical protein